MNSKINNCIPNHISEIFIVENQDRTIIKETEIGRKIDKELKAVEGSS